MGDIELCALNIKVCGFTHVGILMLSRTFRSLHHSRHLETASSGKGSSQSYCSLQISWSICFPVRRAGARNPSGSYTEETVNKIPRLVAGRSFSTILNWKQSRSMDHCMPSTLSLHELHPVQGLWYQWALLVPCWNRFYNVWVNRYELVQFYTPCLPKIPCLFNQINASSGECTAFS